VRWGTNAATTRASLNLFAKQMTQKLLDGETAFDIATQAPIEHPAWVAMHCYF